LDGGRNLKELTRRKHEVNGGVTTSLKTTHRKPQKRTSFARGEVADFCRGGGNCVRVCFRASKWGRVSGEVTSLAVDSGSQFPGGGFKKGGLDQPLKAREGFKNTVIGFD